MVPDGAASSPGPVRGMLVLVCPKEPMTRVYDTVPAPVRVYRMALQGLVQGTVPSTRRDPHSNYNADLILIFIFKAATGTVNLMLIFILKWQQMLLHSRRWYFGQCMFWTMDKVQRADNLC